MRKLPSIILTVFFILTASKLMAQWNSFVRNFTRQEFGLRGQTWSISPSGNGFVFFANGDNVVQYFQGQMSHIQFKTEVRSVMASKNHACLFVGGISEFGYYKPSNNGSMVYTSLSDSLDKETSQMLGNIWQILEHDGAVYFVSDGQIIKHIGSQFSVIHTPTKINYSAIVGGVLYADLDNGLYYLRDSELLQCKGTELVSKYKIKGITGHKDGILLTTQCNGIFYYSGAECQAFKTEADDFITANEIFCSDNHLSELAVGTIKGGIAVIDKETRKARYINEYNGLKNNTVISLSYDHNGVLWTGLDNGIDQVFIDGNLSNLYTYPNFYGAGYDAKIFGSQLFLATNRGLFSTPWPITSGSPQIKISEIPGSGGQVWKLFKYRDKLICLHDRGLFYVENNRLRQVSELQGVWGICQIKENKLLVATYAETYLMIFSDGENFEFQKIGNLSGSFHNIVCSNDTLWMHSHNSTRLTMAVFNNIGNNFHSIREFNHKDGLPTDKQIFVSKIGSEICASSQSGIFVYDSRNNAFRRTEKLLSTNCLHGCRQALVDCNTLIITGENSITFSKNGKQQTYNFSPNFIDLETLINPPSALNDSIFIIPNLNGFSVADISKAQSEAQNCENLISKIYISSLGDSLIYSANFLNCKSVPQISYEFANLRFEYAVNSKSEQFSYRLGSKSEWSEPSTTFTKEFTGLNEGEYTFEVMKIIGGQEVGTESFKFVILPPWYRTFWAYVLWTICLIAAVLMTIYLVHRHINHVRQRVEAQKDEDMKQREIDYERQTAQKEQQIMAMEKEKLENELMHKSNELAGMLINVAGKNEILNELKSDIQHIIDNEQSNLIKQELHKLNTKIDSNIQNDNIIKRFETEFDLLHNNFMQRLQTSHPELSKNERMLCAYIRMELNTKEIAQLLNISVRGVETMRYRLKKKLVIDKEMDLSDYLKRINE